MWTDSGPRPSPDANNMIYYLNASRNYDPSANLERITAPVLWINSADDYINPPELGIAEKMVKRIPHARFILIPISDATRGHGTHTDGRGLEGLSGRISCKRRSRSRSRTLHGQPRSQCGALLYWRVQVFRREVASLLRFLGLAGRSLYPFYCMADAPHAQRAATVAGVHDSGRRPVRAFRGGVSHQRGAGSRAC